MNKLIAALVLTLTLTLSSCALKPIAQGIAANETAPVARQLLSDYIGDDQLAIAQLSGPLNTLSILHKNAQDIDSALGLYEFYVDNKLEIQEAYKSYTDIARIVGQFSVRTQRPIPSELLTWNQDVGAAWVSLGKAVEQQSNREKVGVYLKILAKLVAARHGIIL